MNKLLKYELRKTWVMKAAMLGLTAVAEAAFLIGLYAEREGLLVISVVLLTLLAIGGILLIGVQSVITLHRDMNTRQSYMLFMTPNSCVKILGAKVLENGLSMLLAGAFFFGLGVLDVSLLFAKHGTLNSLWEYVTQMIASIDSTIEINAGSIAALLFAFLCDWLCTVNVAYLADIVATALLNGKSWNGLVSFCLFVALDIFYYYVQHIATRSILPVTSYLVGGCISLVFAALTWFASAKLMEKYLSV